MTDVNANGTFQVLDWAALDAAGRQAALARPDVDHSQIERSVTDIITEVRRNGDRALAELTRRFDGVDIEAPAVDEDDLESAALQLDAGLLRAMDNAIDRIRSFHAASAPIPVRLETANGVLCESRYRPISPVGLYVPGGSAPLVSTVLMLAIPAKLAGCDEIVLCTPPGEGGTVHPAVLAAALRCGVRHVFRVGGAQAIAAMAFGTASIPNCAKLFGPGNAWVTEAKRQVAGLPGGAAQDLPAGPSEVLVIADGAADAQAVAWDLLSQAEHGTDSQSLLLSDSRELLESVAEQLPMLASSLPRSEILQASLGHARLILMKTLVDAVELSNEYAPEHLILNCEEAESLVERVTAAGSVFLGPWTPESLGDYCSGTNHVLPTYGYARAYSGLSVTDFLRRMTVQQASADGLRIAGQDALELASAEGLEAHRMAVEYRLRTLERDR